MAKELPIQDFEPIAPAPVDSATDAIETAAGLTEDAPQTDRPSVDGPVSIAEAAKLLNINADTARKRHLPRILEAIAGTSCESDVMVVTGTTKAGNPVKRLSPLGFELLADFQSTGGDVDAIEGWQREISNRYALPDVAIEDVAIEPEIEPAGALALADSEIHAIALATDWQAETSELIEADWAAVENGQLNLLSLLGQGGDAIEGAVRQAARARAAQIAGVYQSELNRGLAVALSGNVAALTGQAPPKPGPKSRSSAA
jgi:hypothetical protein